MLAVAENRPALIENLRQQVRHLEGHKPERAAAAVSTGAPPLDQLLPHGGLVRGSLTEWLSAQPGSGAMTLALLAAREAAREEGLIVVSDRTGQFHPPAAAALGFDLSRLIVFRAANAADEIWALDQSLRCRGVAAAWANLERLRENDFRRLQLAAESGGTLGLLMRPAKVRGQPSWSDVQLLVQPHAAKSHRQLSVEVLRVRHASPGAVVTLQIDDVTGEVCAASLSHSKRFQAM